MEFKLIVRSGLLSEQERQELNQEYGIYILEHGTWVNWSDTDGSAWCSYYHVDSLAKGLVIMEKLKEKVLHPDSKLEEYKVEIDRKDIAEYLREAACRLDTAAREAIPILKSGRRREPNSRETRVRRILQAAL